MVLLLSPWTPKSSLGWNSAQHQRSWKLFWLPKQDGFLCVRVRIITGVHFLNPPMFAQHYNILNISLNGFFFLDEIYTIIYAAFSVVLCSVAPVFDLFTACKWKLDVQLLLACCIACFPHDDNKKCTDLMTEDINLFYDSCILWIAVFLLFTDIFIMLIFFESCLSEAISLLNQWGNESIVRPEGWRPFF